MIVVLDTNIWLKELALSTGVGAAFRFYMKRRAARLLVPEVVRLEVQAHLRRTIAEAMEDVTRGNRQLLSLFGSMKEIILPTQSEVNALVTGVFGCLGMEILEVPFSLESARSSFVKTIEKLPPSDKTQEFKDGVLWADCLNLLEQDDVLLVSQDKAFYLNREYGKGLADNLREEAANKPGKINLVHSLADVLSHLEVPLDLDESWLLSILLASHTGATTLLERNGGEKIGRENIRYDLFATENPDAVYLSYSIEIPLADATDSRRSNMRMTLTGNAMLHPSVPTLSGLQIAEETLSFTRSDGTNDRVANAYAYAAGVIGHRTIEHSIRHPLKGSG